MDLDDVGTGPLVKELGIELELAEKLVAAAVEAAKRKEAEAKQRQAEDMLQKEKEVEDVSDKA